MSAVTVEIGPKGFVVMVEPEQKPGLDRRVFRFDHNDALSWAHYSDWKANHERARFYGFHSKELPETMTVHTVLRPNYRRARALALEIEALQVTIENARGDEATTSEEMKDLLGEFHHLKREFSLTGVTSEYDL